MAWRVGVNSGGAFTGACLFGDNAGVLDMWKVRSAPGDPFRGIAAGAGCLDHGTTAPIQRKGVKAGLIATEGFRGLLGTGRRERPGPRAGTPPVRLRVPHPPPRR